MGILDFFRKTKTEETEPEKIIFDELEDWLEKKKIETEENDVIFSRDIQGIIKKVCLEFEEEIEVLEKIDLSEKKEHERAKLIIKENLNYYIDYLKKLKKECEELIDFEGNSEVLIRKVNLFFSDFKKRSSASFQKATFLIGKELERVQESISEFFKSLNKIISKNQRHIENSKLIHILGENIRALNRNKELEFSTSSKVKEIEKKINILGLEIESLREEIEKIKSGKEYAEENRKKEEIDEIKKSLEKEIYKLKEMIDFKKLSGIFHSNEKEMKLIKKYQENFRDVLESGEELLNLIRGSGIDISGIAEKINLIEDKKQQIKNSDENFNLKFNSQILIKHSEISKKEREIKELSEEKEREFKKFNKLKSGSEEIKKLISQNIGKLNVKLI